MAKSNGPALNPYVKTKLLKDQDVSYGELLAGLEAGMQDDKLLKTLMHMATPSLFAFPDLPEKTLKPISNLIKFLGETKKDHKKLLRQLYSLLQMSLGPGHAGSTSADNQDEVVNGATITRESITSAWEMLMKPAGDLAQQRVALRVMASIVRSTRPSNIADKKKYADRLAQTLSTILSKDFRIDSGQKDRRLFRSITHKSQSSSSGVRYLQAGALSAARIALSQGGKQRLATKGFALVDCENSLAARHALALAVDLAGKNIESYKEGVGPHLEANIQNYGQEGNLYPISESSSGRPAADDSTVKPLNLHDVFARVYLARGCGMVAHSEGIEESKSTVFWKALVILACNDASDLVSSEAIRVLLGAPAPKAKDLTAGGRHRKEFLVDDDLEAEEQMRRWGAWTAIVKEKPSPIPGKEIDPHATILSRIVERIQQSIQLGSQPTVCGACRSAVVKASDSMVPLQDELMVLATSAWHNNAAQQSLALQSLIWLQGTDGGPLTPPVLTNILGHGNTWSKEMLSELLQTLFQRLVVEPDMATYILDCVNAIVAGNPSKILPVEIVGFWSQSFERASKTMVLRAALQFLEAPSPPRVLASTGTDPVSLAHATEDATSLRNLRRIATWWLGEAANFISDEHVEDAFAPILADAYGMSPSDIIATECMRNPLLATAISHLQQSLLTASWGVRQAAAESLVKIAFKSGEPFRIQIYKLFKEVLSGVEEEVGMDPFGLILVLNPAVDILDAMYSGQAVVEDCIRRWGGLLSDWPAAAAESLHQSTAQGMVSTLSLVVSCSLFLSGLCSSWWRRDFSDVFAPRNTHIVKSVQRYCKIGCDEPYYPLGSKSRSLLLGEEIYLEEQETIQVVETYSLPRTESDAASSLVHPEIIPLKQPNKSENLGVFPGFIDDHVISSSSQVHNDRQHLSGYMIETNEWDVATEHSEESGTPSGQAILRTEADTGTWGQIDGPRVDDHQHGKAIAARASVLSSVPSVGYNPNQSPEVGVNSSVEHTQTQPNSPQYLPEAPSNAAEAFEPRDASVMYDFIAELEGELSVTAGDVISIVDEREGGWYYARLGEKEGLVPCSYVAESDM